MNSNLELNTTITFKQQTRKEFFPMQTIEEIRAMFQGEIEVSVRQEVNCTDFNITTGIKEI